MNNISVEGGAVVPVADPGGVFYPGSWSEDGNIYVGVRSHSRRRRPARDHRAAG
jgi:hypothetical protein